MLGESYSPISCGVAAVSLAAAFRPSAVYKPRKQAIMFGHPCHWLLVPWTSRVLYSDVDFLYTYSQDRPFLLFSGGSKVQTDLFSV